MLSSLAKDIPLSEAHKEIDRRRSRSPRQLADELAQIYGHDFNQVTYIQSLALIARMRLGDQADVIRLAEPYVNGSKDSLTGPIRWFLPDISCSANWPSGLETRATSNW